jgi:HK97 family phage major capsid protein
MQLNAEVLRQLATALKDSGFTTQSDLDKLAAGLIKRHAGASLNSDFSISTVIRGLVARTGQSINSSTRESDLAYTEKALATGTTPGSYLVPTIQANDIIAFLSTNGILRSSGARIWPMDGIQKLNVPVASALPTVTWLGQNSTDTANDPNLGQIAFDLKTRRSLVAIPNELLAVSTPAIDALVTELIGIAFAEHEDDSFFGTNSKANGPTALYQQPNITSLMVGGSANGGNIAYSDILAVLAKAAQVKMKGPFAWYCSPRTFWSRIVGLLDSQSRPLFTGAMASMQDAIQPKLFGSPIFISPFLAENEANGSGTNQAHLIYTNPKYLHVANQSGVEIMVSLDRYLENNQVGVRGIHRADYAVGPAAGVIVLKGIN